jgi:transcriptional regulator with XRE-family HTH domain
VDGTADGGDRSSAAGGDVRRPGNVWRLVQAHIDSYGVREAELARRVGTSPQTLNSWKIRGIRDVPSTAILRKLAAEIRQPYLLVLTAAMLDADRVTPEEADELSRSVRWTGRA